MTLNELSKKTLASYTKKAAVDVHNNASQQGKEVARTHYEVGKKYFNKSIKRIQGISKASDKMAREETENLINAVLEKRPVAFMDQFNAMFKDQISDVVADEKTRLANDLFGVTAEETTTEEDDDDVEITQEDFEEVVATVIENFLEANPETELTDEEILEAAIDSVSGQLNEGKSMDSDEGVRKIKVAFARRRDKQRGAFQKKTLTKNKE